uniref:Uncharacterized protein n=1 Tax=mine drainage metagenome TaxID=410659 RepID=E6PXT5_9ZZZZ
MLKTRLAEFWGALGWSLMPMKSLTLIALAMRNGLTADNLKSMLFAYPTSAADILDMF